MNWDSINQEAITHLQNLIRINTTNPPGNELQAIQYLSTVLNREGIEHKIFEPKPARASLIAHIPGTGEKKPLLLTGHVDTVSAESEHWSHPPFSGEIHDGCIWGRGAIDMKQMVVMELMMMILAKRGKFPPKRDLILAAVADEEDGCRFGSQWLVENHPELLQAEYGLNEVGGFSLTIDDQVFYPIGVAEKGVCWFKVTSLGDPGHGSIPHENQAVVKLAGAVIRLGEQSLPFHGHPVAKKFVADLAQHQKFPNRLALRAMTNKLLHALVLKFIPDRKKAAIFNALFHNTASPTILRAGNKANVIPSMAELEVDGRIIPGQTVQGFLTEIRKIIGDDFGLQVVKQHEPNEMVDYENSFFSALKKSIQAHDPEAIPIPFMISGFTDAAHYSKLGIKCYGFAPVKLNRDMNFAELFHGHNERIPVDGFLFGLKVLWEAVLTC